MLRLVSKSPPAIAHLKILLAQLVETNSGRVLIYLIDPEFSSDNCSPYYHNEYVQCTWFKKYFVRMLLHNSSQPNVEKFVWSKFIALSFLFLPVKVFLNHETTLERTYKPHYDYQNFSPLANGTDLNRQKYPILQTHWH